MASIYVEGKAYEVDPRQNLLEACLSLGFNVPYFCWHPAMGSIGACRQCAIKQYRDENDTEGRIIMSCMTAASDGTRITIDDDESKAFRASVIEWLMINHPHDCPVCEEGGECHLQDMTVMTGHNYRRYRFKKRTYRNQDLGPFINHEMNRCITCYRCVRFYDDYAGGSDLQAFASKNHVYFGRKEDGILENEFSGNLAEICPTGVFTDKTLSERYSRKWDMRATPSVCQHCSLGCNTNPNERYGELRRIVNRYNGEVNRYFICDRGRFGYQFVNSAQRIRRPMERNPSGMGHSPLTKALAIERCSEVLSGRVVGIGSPRASLEANYALRSLVGPENFHTGMSDKDHRLVSTIVEVLKNGPARTPSLAEVEECDAVLILGEDVLNTAPRLALSLRQALRSEAWNIADKLRIAHWNDTVVRNAAQQAKSPLFVLTPYATGLDDMAEKALRLAPDDIARIGFAVANAIDEQAPGNGKLSNGEREWVARIAKALKTARRPLVVAGTGCQSEPIIEAAANVAWSLSGGSEGHEADLLYAVPESNSTGVAMLGGNNLDTAFKAVEDGRADTVVILENDLYRRATYPRVDAFLQKAKYTVVLDYLHNATTAKADYLLPSGSFAETDGTLVSNEGRAQRFFQVFTPKEPVEEGWRWLQALTEARGRSPGWNNLDDVTRACAEASPDLARITEAAPSANFRLAGMRVRREPHRYSGRTAMYANVSVHEPKPPDDPDSPLSFTMEGYPGEPPSSLIPFFWAPAWNSIQSVNKFQDEVGGHLHGGDPGVRLLETGVTLKPGFFKPSAKAFKPRKGEWLTVPSHHIFGSEELSVHSPGIAERAPDPYVAINPADADGIQDGAEVHFEVAGIRVRVMAKLRDDLPRGVAALPTGLPGLTGLPLPEWGHMAGGKR